MGGMSDSPTLAEASMAARDLDGVMGFEHDVLLARPPSQEWNQQEPACFQRGWQHEASSRVKRHHREVNVFPRLSESGRDLVRSQAGPGGGLASAACPTCRITSLDSHLFRVLLLRRLQLPLPLTVRSCRCGHFLDAHGHHRAACARAGVLARRGFSVESVAARICREAGGRVTTNILVRDLDLDLEGPGDARKQHSAWRKTKGGCRTNKPRRT